MNTEFFILLTKIMIWLVFVFLSAFFEMADSALTGLKAREIFGSDQGNRRTVNLWLKHGANIRLALAVWKSIFLGCAVISTVFICSSYNLSFVLRIAVLLLAAALTALVGNFFPRLLVANVSDKSIFRFVKIANVWTSGTHYFNFFIAKAANLLALLMGVKNGLNIFENETDDSVLSEMAEKDDPLEADMPR